jgi:hypothetical protein
MVDEPKTICSSVKGCVVNDDRFAVTRQRYIDLATGRSGAHGHVEGEDRVLWIVEAVAAVRADVREAVVGASK